jgi:hypothetical protein
MSSAARLRRLYGGFDLQPLLGRENGSPDRGLVGGRQRFLRQWRVQQMNGCDKYPGRNSSLCNTDKT